MAEYAARRRLLVGGILYEPGQVVPKAEQLQKFRTLVAAGFLVKVKPVDTRPGEEITKQSGAPLTQLQTEEGLPTQPQVEEGENDDVELQRRPSEQPLGRGEVRDRGHAASRPATDKRGNTVRVNPVRK